MIEAEIEAILNEAIGLMITSIGSSTLERAVNRRMRARGIADKRSYLSALKGSQEELRQLVEEVVVPETWFFRDQKPFQAVQNWALASRQNNKIVRLLSAPCSTGEEPYSLAMALLQAGVPAVNFHVVAIDISTRAINKAIAGSYGDNSFRASDLSFRSRYFKKIGTGYVLNEQVRRNVTFQVVNLLHKDYMGHLGLFDIIFCRNLLIYLDEKAQQQCLGTLSQLLAKDGLLFVGHAEAGIMRGAGFAPVANHAALVFQKITDQNRPSPILLNKIATSIRPPSLNIKAPDSPIPAEKFPEPVAQQPAVIWATASTDLDRARQLADQGRFNEASEFCEKFLGQHGPSAQAFFLLGRIRDSQGELEEAMTLFKKSVYLDPDNADGLMQLALLAERLGDKTGADLFRQRALRIKERGASSGQKSGDFNPATDH